MSNNLHLFVEVSQASYDCLTLFYRRNFDLHRLFYPYRQMRLIIYCVLYFIAYPVLCLSYSQQLLSFFEMFNICFTFVSHFLMQRYVK